MVDENNNLETIYTIYYKNLKDIFTNIIPKIIPLCGWIFLSFIFLISILLFWSKLTKTIIFSGLIFEILVLIELIKTFSLIKKMKNYPKLTFNEKELFYHVILPQFKGWNNSYFNLNIIYQEIEFFEIKNNNLIIWKNDQIFGKYNEKIKNLSVEEISKIEEILQSKGVKKLEK